MYVHVGETRVKHRVHVCIGTDRATGDRESSKQGSVMHNTCTCKLFGQSEEKDASENCMVCVRLDV